MKLGPVLPLLLWGDLVLARWESQNRLIWSNGRAIDIFTAGAEMAQRGMAPVTKLQDLSSVHTTHGGGN